MSGTILLADDSLTIQKVVELTFADTDYRVVTVSSGDELLDRLSDSQPDLIICDVIMPGKDGYEVCQQIKSSPDWLHLPVILLSGTFEPFDRDRAIAAGCSEIITKPFEARKLVDTVERLIGGFKSQPPTAAEVEPPTDSESEAWSAESTPSDLMPETESEEFGTQLSAPEGGDEGLEFSTTGFATMEAAGREPGEASLETDAEDGLDYDFGDSTIDELEDSIPSAETLPPPADPSAQTMRIDLTQETVTEELADDLSPLDPADADGGGGEFEAEPGIWADTVQEPFASAGDQPFGATAESTVEAVEEGGSSPADTSPIEPPPEDAGAVVETQGDSSFRLTDDDIDRIARRVIDLASDRLEQIAWEVVPDMAEIVVRQRIRELEAESEASTQDPIQ